jgi:hypothetical protein
VVAGERVENRSPACQRSGLVKRRASRERGLATPNPPKVPVVKNNRQSGLLACGTSQRIAPNVSGGPPERAATVPRGAVLLQLGRGAAVRVRLQGAAPFDRRKMQKSGEGCRGREWLLRLRLCCVYWP